MSDEVLFVADVMERYALKDARTARRLMFEAGGFKVGGKWAVSMRKLLAYEDRIAVRPALGGLTLAQPRGMGSPQRLPAPSPASGPDWWRKTGDV